jgi:hypothetical protein
MDIQRRNRDDLLPFRLSGLLGCCSVGPQSRPMVEIYRPAEQDSAALPERTATEAAGTVYLCHPCPVHAAQPHRGTTPRFRAQLLLRTKVRFELTRTGGNCSSVE